MTRLIQGIVWTRWFIGLAVLSFAVGAMPVQAEETHEPKSIRKTCGKCPEGYATTGVTEAKEICRKSYECFSARVSPQLARAWPLPRMRGPQAR